MNQKSTGIRIALICYTFFLFLSVPYIRLFQDFVKTNRYTGLYDGVLWFLGLSLVAFVAFSVFYRGRKGIRDLLTYAVAGGFFAGGMSLIGETVERIHFIQYGLLSFLLFLALRESIQDISLYLWTFMISLGIGISDELIQWWVPTRFGEIRDVLLNFMATIFGLLCLIIVWRPEGMTLRLPRARIRGLLWGVAALVLVVTFFIWNVQLGYLVNDPSIGTFRSAYSSEQLLDMAHNRIYPPDEQVKPIQREKDPDHRLTLHALLAMWYPEDFYKTEAEFRVGARNRYEHEDRLIAAAGENAIIERYFTPIIKDSTFRWNEEHVRNLNEQIAKNGLAGKQYVSDIYPHLWVSIGSRTLWLTCIIVLAGLMLIARRFAPDPTTDERG